MFIMETEKEMIMKDKELNRRIGYEMRSQRLLKRLTLEQVAARMGVSSKNTISRMELGDTKITVVDLKAYCDVVGCSWLEVLENVRKYDARL